MKKLLIGLLFISAALINVAPEVSTDKKYFFVYIPGMFDNGDRLNADNKFIRNFLDGGYFSETYFKGEPNGNNPLHCSSSIVNGKFPFISVFNLIGDYRTNIPLELMSDRTYTILRGTAPKGSVKRIMNYPGMDWFGTIEKDGIKIEFYGLIEEIWAKYGSKVYYEKSKTGKYKIVTNEETSFFYLNQNPYYKSFEEVKVHIIAHSSGGLAIRRYLEYCKEFKIDHHIASITNLSVPQKGARLMYHLKNGFPTLLHGAAQRFMDKRDSGTVTVGTRVFTYKELSDAAWIELLASENGGGKLLRRIIGDYIMWGIPFDGKSNVLATDPALYDLHPSHKFIKELSSFSIPEEIPITNFAVKEPYSRLYGYLGEALKLVNSDGAVEYDDTSLDHIPGGSNLRARTVTVDRANHLPLPHIKPLMELDKTVHKNYPILQLVLKKSYSRNEGELIVLGIMYGIMQEIGLDLTRFFKEEDYSVIDYFADNPELWM